jgi:hypothetical protein
MESMNNALLAPLGWKMTFNHSLFWVDSLRNKYLKNGVSFLNASPNPMASWIWKGLLKNRKVVEKDACICFSSGVHVDIWNSRWIPLMPNFRPTPNANLVDLLAFSMAYLMLPSSQTWNLHLLHDLFDASKVQNILSIHLLPCPSFNKWYWVPSCSGIFFLLLILHMRFLFVRMADLLYFHQMLGIPFGVLNCKLG